MTIPGTGTDKMWLELDLRREDPCKSHVSLLEHLRERAALRHTDATPTRLSHLSGIGSLPASHPQPRTKQLP